MTLSVVLKYKEPDTKAFPSLSTVTSEVFCPKYLSSNESNAARAASLDACADEAEVAALVALDAALVSETDALSALTPEAILDASEAAALT
jgi:hypothetical protein